MRIRMVSPLRTLRSRLTLGVVFLVGLSVTLVGTVGVIATYYAETTYRDQILFDRLDMLQQKLAEGRRHVGADGLILANLPTVQGLIRAAQNGGIDPSDGFSTEKMWEDRLKNTFTSFHGMREEYLQIRLIRFSDGNEIVRVNKSANGITAVDTQELQNKKNAPYYKIAKELSAGEYHLMSPTLNRENGVVQIPHVAVSRLVIPVFGKAGVGYGFLIINYDTLALNKKIIDDVKPDGDVVIRNTIGGTYFYDSAKNEADMYFDNEDTLSSGISKALTSGRNEQLLSEVGDHIVAVKPLGVDRPKDKQVLLAIITPNKRLEGLIGVLSLLVASFGAIIVLLSAFIALLFTRIQLAPFWKMKDEIQRAKIQSDRPILPKKRRDEIGEVAREFDTMLDMLDSRRKRMDFFFNGANDGICIISSDRKILEVNQALAATLGYRTNELIGRDFEYLLAKCSDVEHRTVLQRMFHNAQETPLRQTTTESLRCKNASEVDVELSIDQIDSGPNFHFAAVVRDISERKRAETERECLVEALRTSNDELDSFAYVASHDLKAPLRAIETASRWLSTDLEGKLDEDSQENLDLMRSRVFRMDQLLDGILEHARIGRKTASTRSRVLLGADLAEDIRDLLNCSPSFSIRFSKRFSEKMYQQMPLRTVLLNLISNGIKHHDRPDGVIKVDAENIGKMVRFTVTDDGPGIDPQFHERVFQLFQTLKSRDIVEGSGLGLAMCQKQVRLMGGELKLTSEGNGSGSTFSFTWPHLNSSEVENAA